MMRVLAMGFLVFAAGCGAESECTSTVATFLDADGDGFGDASTQMFLCADALGNRVLNGTDCDDTDPNLRPDALEVCGGGDEDCDGLIDLDDPSVDLNSFVEWFQDADDDGFGDRGNSVVVCGDADVLGTGNFVADFTDCNDDDSAVFPGAPEMCDGLDNDCDDVVPSNELDGDGDGFFGCTGDCDDTNALVNPGQVELCDGGIDNDCNPSTTEFEDLDADGQTVCEGDCDDADPNVTSNIEGVEATTACPTSCSDALGLGGTSDGMYWIASDDVEPSLVYCDQNTDGGGWTLLAHGGAVCREDMLGGTEFSPVGPDTLCGFMPQPLVESLALAATDVQLRGGSSFGEWTETANSTNGLVVAALQQADGTWHNGALFDAWVWTGIICPTVGARGWPDMFHGCGNVNAVHWFFDPASDGTVHGQCRTHLCPDAVTSTWLR